MSRIVVGDYIRFKRVVQPAVKQKCRSSTGKNFDIVTTPEVIILESGSGLVVSIAKNKRTLNGCSYQTARVDAGPIIGMVTAVIDDAVIIAAQTTLFAQQSAVYTKNVYNSTGEIA